MTKVNPLPNILTWIRLVSGLVMFVLLAGAAGGVPVFSAMLSPDDQFALERYAFVAFVIGSITDFFDGVLARVLHAESQWGAILDPIADKILVTGTILGIFALGAQPVIALPCAVILFREFAVSALRESTALKGLTIKVTLLAKIKTTVQLVALGAYLLIECWAAFGLPLEMTQEASDIANVLIWVAAAITLWTGLDYFFAAGRAIKDD